MEINEEIQENIDETTNTIEQLTQELEQYKDKYIRLYAELDNIRKRHAREIEEMRTRANENIIVDLIAVFDSFDLAIIQVNHDNNETSFVEGVKLIAAEFQKALEKAGAEIIITEPHQAFDPTLHEALASIANCEFESGTIINQFRKGWKLGKKVIRPAQVIVCQ